MNSLYNWIKAFHVISIISWMAGILYLYRLFIYHIIESEAVVKERFQMMELRLFKFITVPAMVVAVLTGSFMISQNWLFLGLLWLQLKLVLVLFLIFSTIYAHSVRIQLKESRCRLSHKTLRVINEVPTLLMVGIVLLVILRPF